MSAALQPTLAEARQEVMNRCGLATEGNIPRAVQGTMDSRIRSAQKQLYELYPWLRNYVTGEITLSNGVRDYDVPDDTEPGEIDYISVRRISDGWVYPLERGVRPVERNYLISVPPANSMPMRFDFINGIIRIDPAPDTTYFDVLQLQYYQVIVSLVEDTDRLVIDGEAVIMYAEILTKQHYGGQDTTKLENQLGLYIQKKMGKQGNGSGFQMGGHQSVIGKTQPRNRFFDRGGNGGWGRGWWPW
jgi:hypothetical protein